MTLAEARLHLKYSAWASFKLIEVVRDVPNEDFEKPVGVSHSALSGTLAHILWADWLWYTRVVEPMENPGKTQDAIELTWPRLLNDWIRWADRTSEAAWQIILHVVNHATLHRGPIMGNYYRQLPA